VDREDQQRAGRLVEVDVARQVAEDRVALVDVGPGIGATVGGGIKPGAVDGVVLDELGVGIELRITWSMSPCFAQGLITRRLPEHRDPARGAHGFGAV
jgi:hypothetical protein